MKRVLLLLFFAFSVFAQDARELAVSGKRAEALRLLEEQLATHPDDLDARTLYGTILSWDGQYERARAELERVLAADPSNADARAALANVERWSRDRAYRREVNAGVEYEEIPGGDWTQAHVAARFGTVVVRGTHAKRGDFDDDQAEVELYPRFGPRSYAYVTGAISNEGTLYPDWRLGAEYFHGFGKGFEASAGYRHLAFDDDVNLVTGSLGKYAGNWLFLGRAYLSDGDWSWQGLARLYRGDDGAYYGVRVGTARDELRSGVDVIALDEREVVGEALWVVRERWVVGGRAGVARRNDDERLLAAVTLGLRY